MLLVINNSNRNEEVLKYLKKSKRLLGFSKKCNLSKKNNQTRTIHVTDKLINYLKKKEIPYKNIVSKDQLKKFLKNKEEKKKN